MSPWTFLSEVLEKVRNGEPLTSKDRAVFKPYKPFYFGWDGAQPHQIKNSVVVLTPPVNGKPTVSPELEKMRKWMTGDAKIDQVQMLSAHKLGSTKATEMWDNETNTFVEPAEGYEVHTLSMAHHRNQVNITEHSNHGGTVGLGTQTSKIVTSNLRDYPSLGESHMQKLMDAEAKLMQYKHKELKAKLYKPVKGEKSVSERKEVDIAKLKKYVLENFRDDVDPAAISAMTDDTASRNSPLLSFVIDQVLKAAIQNDFKKMKVAGGTQVQISDLGHTAPDGTPLRGMEVKDGKVLLAQGKMNRKFLPPQYRDMSIEEIKKLDPKLLEVMVYRVPAEGKNSMAMVEIVEFLPDGHDGMIVPAAFVAQMGSDFDIDKLFVNWRKVPKEGKTLNKYDQKANEYFELQRQVLTHPDVVQKEVLVPQGFETIKAFRRDNVGDRNLAGVSNIDRFVRERPYSAVSHLSIWSDNTAGVSLKGSAANNNTFWINAQRYNIKLEGMDMKDLPREVLQWNAEAVAASMDGAKDPVWGQMGITQSNFGFFMYECAMGYMRLKKMYECAMGYMRLKKELGHAKALEQSRIDALRVATDPEVMEALSTGTPMMEQPTEQGEAHRNKLQNYRNVNSRRRGKANKESIELPKTCFESRKTRFKTWASCCWPHVIRCTTMTS
jgi:hypothetical protein